jgi:hypothetical protein
MFRVLENRVRRLFGVGERNPGFFVMHSVPPYSSADTVPVRAYTIPAAKLPDDFLAACWRDIGNTTDEKALYAALDYYMWSHAVVERIVVLKTRSWVGLFTIQSGDAPTMMILEVLP